MGAGELRDRAPAPLASTMEELRTGASGTARLPAGLVTPQDHGQGLCPFWAVSSSENLRSYLCPASPEGFLGGRHKLKNAEGCSRQRAVHTGEGPTLRDPPGGRRTAPSMPGNGAHRLQSQASAGRKARSLKPGRKQPWSPAPIMDHLGGQLLNLSLSQFPPCK